MFLVLGPLIRLGTSSRTLSRTSALCHRPFPKSQVLSSRCAPVLPVPLSTLAPSIVGTRSLIGTNEGLTAYLVGLIDNVAGLGGLMVSLAAQELGLWRGN